MKTFTPEELALLSPDELKLYSHQLNYELAKSSPLDLTCWLSPITQRTRHLEYLNDRIVALIEYRLYHKAGPGPKADWFYITRASEDHIPVESPYEIPFEGEDEDEVLEYWGQHPDDPDDRVCFNLGIAIPPRHGKSWLVTDHLPLWIWARFPDMHIGFATYSDDFSMKWGKRLRTRILESQDKLGLTLPGGDRHDSQHLYFKETNGEMFLVGTGGSMTGRGWGVGLIDDPFKDAADAASPATRQTKGEWYEGVFSTRGTPTPFFPIPVQIMTFTRWHEDDLAGRFVYDDQKKVRPEWHMVRIPALAMKDDPLGRVEGAALWPKIYTAKALLKRQERDPLYFGAMYQGWPTMGDKGMFGRWSTYDLVDGIYSWKEDDNVKRVHESECVRFAVVDTAFTTSTWSDYSVFAVWDFDRRTQRGFLRHIDRVRVESPSLAEWLRGNARRWNPTFIGVEDIASGKQLLQELRSQADLVLRPLKPGTDKVSRALGYAQACANGTYLLPTHGAWVADYQEEHSLFPDSGTHDDMVDTGAYAHHVMTKLPMHKDTSDRYIVDNTAEGRVKAMQERMDRQAMRKNQSPARKAMSGRLGR